MLETSNICSIFNEHYNIQLYRLNVIKNIFSVKKYAYFKKDLIFILIPGYNFELQIQGY